LSFDSRASPVGGWHLPACENAGAAESFTWIADLLNIFGEAGGFSAMQSMIRDLEDSGSLLMASLIGAFGGKAAALIAANREE
jgi:hypothetical protein